MDGKDYYFISRSDFEEMVKAEKFLEWAEYAGNYYGTPRLQVEEHIARGESVILEIELEGARQIGKTFPDALRIFILPPSLPELEQRIRRRGTDSEEAISRRLSRAGDELAAATEFDIQIINDDLENTIHRIEAALFTYNPPFPVGEP
jgi:guanylate kinase